MFKDYLFQHQSVGTPLIKILAQNLTWESEKISIKDLRASEKDAITLEDSDDYIAIFDLRSVTRLTAGLSIVRTIFVCVLLTTGSLYFSKDAHEIVILPIEQMIKKVNSISKNPIEAAQDEAT